MIAYLICREGARQILEKIVRDYDWNEGDTRFDFWLVREGHFVPSEEDWSRMKERAPLLYAQLNNDV